MMNVMAWMKPEGPCSPGDDGDQGEGDGSSAPEEGKSRAVLVEICGPDQGRICRLTQTHTSLGRGDRRSIRIRDRSVSRYHARIIHYIEGFVFEDEKSMNGSYVNHERVDRVILKPGDLLQLGPDYRTLFMLLSPEEEERLLGAGRQKNPTAEIDGYGEESFDDDATMKSPPAMQSLGPGPGILVVNIDHLGMIKSAYGPRAGEEVQDQLSDILKQWIPKIGTIIRCQDGRLLVTVPDLAFSSAAALAEKFRLAVQRTSIISAEQSTMCTVSVAVLNIDKKGIIAKDSNLLHKADELLAKAKAAGGNKVVTAA